MAQAIRSDPSGAEAAAGERYLLLADISGYTGFMSGVEAEHGIDFSDGIPAAYSILGDLLASVVEGVKLVRMFTARLNYGVPRARSQ